MFFSDKKELAQMKAEYDRATGATRQLERQMETLKQRLALAEATPKKGEEKLTAPEEELKKKTAEMEIWKKEKDALVAGIKDQVKNSLGCILGERLYNILSGTLYYALSWFAQIFLNWFHFVGQTKY